MNKMHKDSYSMENTGSPYFGGYKRVETVSFSFAKIFIGTCSVFHRRTYVVQYNYVYVPVYTLQLIA